MTDSYNNQFSKHGAVGLLADGPAVPGRRVRVVAPEYVGTGVYHTLYLPPDWTPQGSYPVIVEYPPNKWEAFAGTVAETHMGFYQSGGAGCIWVSMPFIDHTADPKSEATLWWGNGSEIDPKGQSLTAEYTRKNLTRILNEYAGDPSAVFVTGFSRGAIACGYIALCDEVMADIWLGFLPHSHHDGGEFTPDPGNERLSRIAGRGSFITYGENDPGAAGSIAGENTLKDLGFPVESREVPGIDHTDKWILDSAGPAALAVRKEMRQWIAETVANKPGTSSIAGKVTDGFGAPLKNARVQSGATHWTFTDSDGNYILKGLARTDRTLIAECNGCQSEIVNIKLSNKNLTGKDLIVSLDN